MKKNKIIDMIFFSILIASTVLIFECAFADPTNSTMSSSQTSSPSNSQLLFQYSNNTGSSLPGAAITVFTDKSSYVGKEFIIISGKVSSVTNLKFVVMEIFNPDGGLVHVEKPLIQGGGAYYTSFITGSYNWNKVGTYTIKVSYGNSYAKTNFHFSTIDSSGELTLNDVKLMRSTGITQLYNEINALNAGTDFSSNYTNAATLKNVLLYESQTINRTVLDNEYYATFVGLTKIKDQANLWLASPAKEKISILVDQLIISLRIETTPEFPFFVPVLLGFIFILLLSMKNRLFFRNV